MHNIWNDQEDGGAIARTSLGELELTFNGRGYRVHVFGFQLAVDFTSKDEAMRAAVDTARRLTATVQEELKGL